MATRTLWSGADEVAEYDASGTLLRRFIPDGSGTMDARLAAVEADGTVTWLHTNHQGSVVATSNGSGAVRGWASYSPSGELAAGQTAPPPGSPFGYTGRQWDAETGLWQYRARYYSPRLGQFLSTDPLGMRDDPNLYLYVANDPVNGTDPTGRETRSNGPNWVLIPEAAGFGRTEVPRPWLAPRNLNEQTTNFHTYSFSHTIVGAGSVPPEVFQAIVDANPVPNPARSAASVDGTRNDATAPGPLNGVMSYIRTGDGGEPMTINVTRTGEHALAHGWVATTHEASGANDRNLLTYGEGNSIVQADNFLGNGFGAFMNKATWDMRAQNVQTAVDEYLKKNRQ